MLAHRRTVEQDGTGAQRTRKQTRPFDAAAALRLADEAMAREPALARLARPVVSGERVARFVLPLDACKPQNRTNHRSPWAYQADRKRVAMLMGVQCPRRREPLRGRPTVVCTRFSSVEPDAFADWAKMAVDVLTMPTGRAMNRLGLIEDDRPAKAEVIQRWEPAKRGEGFCLIEVWTGEAT